MDREPNAFDRNRLSEAQKRVDAEVRAYPVGEIRRVDPVYPLRRALDRFVVRTGLTMQISASELERLWESILGPAKARMTAVGAVRRGVLQVTVGNSGLLEELELFRKAEILKRLRSSPVGSKIRDVRFRIGNVRTPDEPGSAPPDRTQPR